MGNEFSPLVFELGVSVNRVEGAERSGSEAASEFMAGITMRSELERNRAGGIYLPLVDHGDTQGSGNGRAARVLEFQRDHEPDTRT